MNQETAPKNGASSVPLDKIAIRKDLGERPCAFCGNGVVAPCSCGCASNGAGIYRCSNKDCTGDEFQILGV